MKTKTQKIILSALFSALIFVTTSIIKIPSPIGGYINPGDCIVLLAGWILPPAYGFLSAGIGSCLSDILSPYAIYAPATFIIKGLMALTAYYGFNFLSKYLKKIHSRILSGFISEIIMVSGYYIFEGFLYGFIASAVNIIPNTIQGIFGLILGLILINIFNKNNIIK